MYLIINCIIKGVILDHGILVSTNLNLLDTRMIQLLTSLDHYQSSATNKQGYIYSLLLLKEWDML